MARSFRKPSVVPEYCRQTSVANSDMHHAITPVKFGPDCSDAIVTLLPCVSGSAGASSWLPPAGGLVGLPLPLCMPHSVSGLLDVCAGCMLLGWRTASSICMPGLASTGNMHCVTLCLTCRLAHDARSATQTVQQHVTAHGTWRWSALLHARAEHVPRATVSGLCEWPA